MNKLTLIFYLRMHLNSEISSVHKLPQTGLALKKLKYGNPKISTNNTYTCTCIPVYKYLL